MKPVRLPAAATLALPRWGLFALALLYILPGLFGRDPWKNDDAASFGILWTMAHGGLADWLAPNIAGLSMPQDGPFAYWIGALCVTLFGGAVGDVLASRLAAIVFFLLGALSVWYTAFLLGRRGEAQPLRLAFGGQPEPDDYGRTLADGAVLIYLGFLGLLKHSHSSTPGALQVALVAFILYASVKLFDAQSKRMTIALGVALGFSVLTRGLAAPLVLMASLLALAGLRDRAVLVRLATLSLPLAILVPAAWVLACSALPAGYQPVSDWLAWNAHTVGWPSAESLRYFLKNGIWFAWPAWPFAGWAVYAWRKQCDALHIALPLLFVNVLALLAIFNPGTDENILLPMLPALAILAAFGLPTMKRGAINAVDWFSVMTLTTCAAFIWIGWVAKQTGWPAQLARNAFKLAPGFKPEFSLLAFLIAAAATASWFVLVRWRISRRPQVLWRAVVLSSGGVILCWLLLMTLWLPWGNYMKSYAGVADQIAASLPPVRNCVASDVGPAQRASFAFFGQIPFARNARLRCDFLLLQDTSRDAAADAVASTSTNASTPAGPGASAGAGAGAGSPGGNGADPAPRDESRLTRGGDAWRLVWQGHRPADRDERFRLYRRIP